MDLNYSFGPHGVSTVTRADADADACACCHGCDACHLADKGVCADHLRIAQGASAR